MKALTSDTIKSPEWIESPVLDIHCMTQQKLTLVLIVSTWEMWRLNK